MRFRRLAAPPVVAPSISTPSGVTRRGLLKAGGVAGAATLISAQLTAVPATAATVDNSTPDYLRRSSYAHLAVLYFSATRDGKSTPIKLEALEDLPAAATDNDLKGSEDAFTLAFSAEKPIDGGIYELAHPELGSFDLFISPVANGVGYEAVVNRSVGAPKSVPRAPRNPQHRMQRPDAHAIKPVHSNVKRIRLRRSSRGLVCEVILAHGNHGKQPAPVTRVTAWVERNGRPVATTSRTGLHGHRLAFRVPTERRLRGGDYDVTVATTDRDGDIAYAKARVALA
jgi:hypothetical protein